MAGHLREQRRACSGERVAARRLGPPALPLVSAVWGAGLLSGWLSRASRWARRFRVTASLGAARGCAEPGRTGSRDNQQRECVRVTGRSGCGERALPTTALPASTSLAVLLCRRCPGALETLGDACQLMPERPSGTHCHQPRP